MAGVSPPISSDSSSLPPSVPSFLVMSHTDDADMKAMSPFLISGLVGTVKSIEKLCTGSLLTETATSAQSTTLLQASALGPYPIKVEAHQQLNFSRGVISCFDLLEGSTAEIAAELAAHCGGHPVHTESS